MCFSCAAAFAILGWCYRSYTLVMLCDGFFIQFVPLAYVTHGLLGGKLLTLLLGVAESGSELQPLDADTAAEGRAVGTHRILIHQLEQHLVLGLLAPLDELALEVIVLLGHLVNVDMLADEPLLEEAVTPRIATVEVNGPHERLESVARDETVVGTVDVGRLYELHQPRILGDTVETAALHYLATYRGEESLFLRREMMVQYIAHHRLNDSIAQIFEPLIVLLLLARAMMVERAVHQRLTVDINVARIETQYAAQLAAKLLVAAEEVVYVVGQMGGKHGMKDGMIPNYIRCIPIV